MNRAVLWLLLCISVLASACLASGTEYEVIFTSVVHRSGAHNPDVKENALNLCGYEYPCGGLTDVGSSMMQSLGSYLRARYNDAQVVDAPFFPSTRYNQSLVQSEAVGVDRNVQSANSMLAGLFPDQTGLSHAVTSRYATTDVLLNAANLPRAFVRLEADRTLLEATMAPVVKSYFRVAQLRALGSTVGVPIACGAIGRLYECAATLYEVGVAFRSSGRLSSVPALQAALPNLTLIHAAAEEWVYGYDPKSEVDRRQGAMGQQLAEAIVSQLNEVAANNGSVQRAHQYSVHGSQLEALLVVLGDQSTETFAPAFGTSVQVELLRHKSNGAYAVQLHRVVPSNPTVNEAGAFEYVASPPQLHCMNAITGEAYTATNNICPLDDFAAFVRSSEPLSPDGPCMLSSNELAALDCGATTGTSDSPYCARYRSMCPSTSCADGYVLNAVNLACTRLLVPDDCLTDKVLFTQVIHRHGARTSIVSVNQTEICGYEYPCGYLTNKGQEMMYAVGEFLRNRYNDVSIVNEPFFTESKYNASLVYSRSTGYERTLQSSAALLSGLFPDDELFFPAIFSVNKTIDFLLIMDTHPRYFVWNDYDDDGMDAAFNPIVDQYFTFEELQEVADELYYGGSCLSYVNRSACARKLYDIAASFIPDGRLAQLPKAEAAFPGLSAVQAGWFKFLFAWNASTPLDRTEGTMAQELAQLIVANMNSALVSPSYKMMEYSAHDTTVSPLAVALGTQNNETFLPPFGETIIVELLQSVSGTNSVRVLRGSPQLNSSEDYEFANTGFPLNCIDSNGNMYEAEDSTCPLEDFERMVDYSVPSERNGGCIVNQTLYNRMNCPLTNASSEALSADCAQYRLICPFNSCPDGYILAAGDLQCYAGKSSSDNTTPVTPGYSTPIKQVAVKSRAKVAQKQRVARQLVIGVGAGLAMGSAKQ